MLIIPTTRKSGTSKSYLGGVARNERESTQCSSGIEELVRFMNLVTIQFYFPRTYSSVTPVMSGKLKSATKSHFMFD